MPILIASSMLTAFSVFVALFGETGRRADSKKRRLYAISDKHAVIDEDLETPFFERFFFPIFLGILKAFSRILPKDGRKETSLLEKKIRQAGIIIPVNEYSAAKMMTILGTIGVTFLLAFMLGSSAASRFFIILIGCIVSIAGPNFYLSVRIKKRQEAIRNQMPDIMDLLTVGVEAGLGFDAALLKISERFEGPLVDEFMIVHREIQMALPRREALKKFADRVGLDELKTFVGAIIQAEQMGLPIKNVLRTQSSQMRLARKQAAEEKAMKAPIKMMLPMILFVFPVIFIVLLGPTVLQLLKTFG